VNTTDLQEHTFCGIMFPVQCEDVLPVECMLVTSISIRGQLGPITVWVSNDDNDETNENQFTLKNPIETALPKNNTCVVNKKREKTMITATQSHWTKIFSKTLPPSFRTYQELDLSENPIYLDPGQVRGVYIHSSLSGDQSIVYDNYMPNVKAEIPEDLFLRLGPAMAHLSKTPFANLTNWGYGDAWRRNRKFVGKINYEVTYPLWNPNQHLSFGSNFQNLAMLLFACQRRFESPLSRLPEECILYILSMCKWDWASDDYNGMIKYTKKRKKVQKEGNACVEEEDAERHKSGNCELGVRRTLPHTYITSGPILYEEKMI